MSRTRTEALEMVLLEKQNADFEILERMRDCIDEEIIDATYKEMLNDIFDEKIEKYKSFNENDFEKYKSFFKIDDMYDRINAMETFMVDRCGYYHFTCEVFDYLNEDVRKEFLVQMQKEYEISDEEIEEMMYA